MNIPNSAKETADQAATTSSPFIFMLVVCGYNRNNILNKK